MAELEISKHDSTDFIRVADWRSAVEAHPFVRFPDKVAPTGTVLPPTTRTGLVATAMPNDAELWNAKAEEWQLRLGWQAGSVTVYLDPEDLKPKSPVLRISLELAQALNAVLLNDDGEIVDLDGPL